MRKIKELPEYIKDLPMSAMFDAKTVVSMFGFSGVKPLRASCMCGAFPMPDEMLYGGFDIPANRCFWKKSTIMREYETRRKLNK